MAISKEKYAFAALKCDVDHFMQLMSDFGLKESDCPGVLVVSNFEDRIYYKRYEDKYDGTNIEQLVDKLLSDIEEGRI